MLCISDNRHHDYFCPVIWINFDSKTFVAQRRKSLFLLLCIIKPIVYKLLTGGEK